MDVINLPNATSTWNSVTDWSAPTFAQFIDVAFVAIGLFGAGVILIWLVSLVTGAIGAVFGRKDDSIF